MIELIVINILVVVLYARTYKYKQLVDDFVPRSGVLLVLGERPENHSFYDKQRPLLATVTNVVVFMASCSYIDLIWGFWPAIFFAVLPTNVCGGAWTTGNYYMSTVLLTLAAHYCLITFSNIVPIQWAFYTAALGSTVNAIPLAFVEIITRPSWQSVCLLIPLAAFLFGHRFRTGLKLRKEKHSLIKIDSGKVSFSKIFVMVKVTGYYIILNLWPSRLGFFHEYPKYAHKEAPDKLFWLNLILISLFACLGYQYNFEGMVWWFLFIGVFSQFTTYGQFIAERYMVLANIGFILIINAYLGQHDTIKWILATLWFCNSWGYVRAYKSNLTLFHHSIQSFPGAPENYNNLASHYLERGQREKAIEPLLLCLRFSGINSPNIHTNLANCYAQVGYYHKALLHTQEALKGCADDKKDGLLAQCRELQDKLEKIAKNKQSLKKYGII